jgi:hypothetical protein
VIASVLIRHVWSMYYIRTWLSVRYVITCSRYSITVLSVSAGLFHQHFKTERSCSCASAPTQPRAFFFLFLSFHVFSVVGIRVVLENSRWTRLFVPLFLETRRQLNTGQHHKSSLAHYRRWGLGRATSPLQCISSLFYVPYIKVIKHEFPRTTTMLKIYVGKKSYIVIYVHHP